MSDAKTPESVPPAREPVARAEHPAEPVVVSDTRTDPVFSDTPGDPVVTDPVMTDAHAEPVVERRSDPVAERRSDPVVVEPAPVATTATTPPVATTTTNPPVVVENVVTEKPKRGIGAWSFVLGLITVLVDIAFVIFVIVAVVGAIGGLSAGTLEGAPTALAGAGLALLSLFIFFAGFLSAGVAIILGIIAVIGGRGRVLGLFGLLFGVAAIVARVLLLTGGFSPDLV